MLGVVVVLRHETFVSAPPAVCFDLARSQRAHVASAAGTGERIEAGPPRDLLELDDEVTFVGRHFGVRMRMTARITEFERPHRFVDEMVRGPFRLFRHEHRFIEERGRTRMVDDVAFAHTLDPLGLAGRLVGRHLRKFLAVRGQALARMAVRAGP
jgi:hypothetical protein